MERAAAIVFHADRVRHTENELTTSGPSRGQHRASQHAAQLDHTDTGKILTKPSVIKAGDKSDEFLQHFH